jgi:chromosome segregation ATPase
VVSGNRPGSPTHSLVTNLGHGIGYKFKPWEAVRWAKRLNIAVQIAMTLFQFRQELQAAKKEEQQDRAALLSLRRQIKDAADGLITQAREDVDPLVSRFYGELTQPVEELEARVTDLRQQREALAQEVQSLDARSRAALRRTGVETAAGRS